MIAPTEGHILRHLIGHQIRSMKKCAGFFERWYPGITSPPHLPGHLPGNFHVPVWGKSLTGEFTPPDPPALEPREFRRVEPPRKDGGGGGARAFVSAFPAQAIPSGVLRTGRKADSECSRVAWRKPARMALHEFSHPAIST